MKNFITVILLIVSSSYAFGQVSNQKAPPSWELGITPDTAPMVMPVVNVEELLLEDATKNADVLLKPYRFGKNIDVSMDLFNSGAWTTLENGDRIWQLNIVSTGAKTINLLLDRYDLPAGAELYLYNNEHTDKIGPYTSAENQEDGVLGTWIVYGDDIWLEYYEPASVKGLGRVSIDEVVHGYRGFGSLEDSFLKLNESGNCNVDVMCDPNQGSSNGQDWTTIRNNYRHSVARIIINGGGLCTGTLVNNVREDGTPYFLTANHCLGNVNDGAGTSYSASNWSFGFDWFTNTPDCATFSNTSGPFNPTRVVSGAVLRANRGASDVALFELNQTPPASWDLYYAGWNNSTTPATSQLSMHHPSGDIMKMSRNDQSTVAQTVSGIACWTVANWDYGVTEGGSSGGCLINPQGQIIGQLLGGGAACTGTNDNGQPDFYGRMSTSWNSGGTASRQLKNWLDPDNTNVVTYDGDYYSTLSTDASTMLRFNVFPNPSRAIFNFDIEEEASYQIYNVAGKMISSGVFNDGNKRINLSHVSNGLYFVTVTTINGSVTEKLIKE
ncbi:T9SS type A sorting domain-containing protein [Nonlabens sp.]|uniref:T9SS type A sorting domain-containing protein n=1 Tax=Nonlabens sp. TaxID=1888209 RepID=UPI003F69BD56